MALRPVRHVRATVVALVVAAVAASTLLLAPTPASATVPYAAKSFTPAQYADRVHKLINKRRAAHGLRPLKDGTTIDRIARNRAQRLVENREFRHYSLKPLFSKANASYAGENLVSGPFGPRRAVRAWMKSPGHRKIMLSKKPNKVGVGAAVTRDGAWLTVADFVRN
ncbi:CAP domain-containing protein [Nocardioides sp. GY 10113]|uniref:CAP domain-containing protein n=1 Tax=Nocardioides sp. GY 10113 TaxID=2569761 RepID=UPI0010A7E58C|nr:CAP domain-containing protein [Nocardioides sp. GY 10113]TIC87885.1 CAP domain-containing protein [Nocardioides sp. GY 10113]